MTDQQEQMEREKEMGECKILSGCESGTALQCLLCVCVRAVLGVDVYIYLCGLLPFVDDVQPTVIHV